MFLDQNHLLMKPLLGSMTTIFFLLLGKNKITLVLGQESLRLWIPALESQKSKAETRENRGVYHKGKMFTLEYNGGHTRNFS